ncbi:MAG: alpha/beta hydrolase [Candidatus Abyssobacteria bacterium SURF_5]|uniref:Alpha/beta hydrolase n=1 Tax=Abyssobacteria bacterium (strain SURF_5) TaxID=2093360 RepID=A0A3A4N949_ABYX5|nr:MAG: alpha/beta hydrolase [Candidatus Abyssubacteria bacterium SURF_5]
MTAGNLFSLLSRRRRDETTTMNSKGNRMEWRDYQAAQKVAELNGRFMSFAEEGRGLPILLLHGIPTWGYLWHRLIPALAETRRVLAPDLLGFGYSDKSDRFDRSIRCQTEMIATWMEATEMHGAAVVGHDIGGGIALRLATLYPHLVSHLCLMNSVCYDSWPIEMMLQFGHPEADRKMSASAAQTVLKQALKKGFSNSPNDGILEGLLAPYATEIGKRSLIRNAASLNTNQTTELTHLLPRIHAPALILWGEDDPFQPLKYGERLAWDIPKTRLIRIANARHFVMLDQPQEVERHLLVFLES